MSETSNPHVTATIQQIQAARKLPGDVGNLTPQQQQCFDAVEQAIKQEYNQYTAEKEQIHKARWLAKNQGGEWEGSTAQKQFLSYESTDFPYLICRHSRAQRWNTQKAIESIRATFQWRRQNRVDQIIDYGEPAPFIRYIAPADAGTMVTKELQPIYYELDGGISVDGIINCATLDEWVQIHILVQETIGQKMREVHAQHGKLVDSSVIVMDLTGISMKIRKILYVLQAFIKIDQSHYPERMAFMICLNAPYFIPLLWRIVRIWLDARTRAKVMFVSSNQVTEALSMIADRDQILPTLGGTSSLQLQCYTDKELLQKFGIDTKKGTVNGKSCSQLSKFTIPNPQMQTNGNAPSQQNGANGAATADEDSDTVESTEEVPAGKTTTKSIHCKHPATFEYTVAVAENDIQLQIEFVPADGSSSIMLHQLSKVQNTVDGEYVSAIAGELRVTLSNAHSWTRGKRVNLVLAVAPSNQATATS